MSALNTYKIEHRILTLSECAVMDKKGEPASFDIDGVNFSHWDFNYRDGWVSDAWIAMSTITAENYVVAINELIKKLTKLIPRISLISQSYIEFISEPFLIHKVNSDVAFFRYITDARGGGLMFMENEQKALSKILEAKDIPETFYYYWNDATNTTGYSSKLLLMFSAIEALVKKNGSKDWDFIHKILGEDLVKELFGTKEQPNTGLRHRLVHGEYFTSRDNGKNYLELVHNKVIAYFNASVISESLIPENIVHPQRHFWGNKKQGNFVLRHKNGSASFSLKDLLKDFNDNGFRKPENYESVFDNKLMNTY